MKIYKDFIAIDGPNGVGKSAIIDLLSKELTDEGINCILTREPTNSTLGNFIREKQNSYYSRTLASLIAADRYDHIENVILPNLHDGKIVITDRYLASSLVYQVQDGLTYEFILKLNAEIILPGLYFILTATQETLTKRLQLRKHLTRFESAESVTFEGALYEEAGNLLAEKGVKVCFIKTESPSSEKTVSVITAAIKEHLNI